MARLPISNTRGDTDNQPNAPFTGNLNLLPGALRSADANFTELYGAFTGVQISGALANAVSGATTTSDSWATIKANIDGTIAVGGHLDIWGHTINSAGGNLGTFKQTIDYLVYLRDKGLCDLLTAPQYYAKYLTASQY